MPAMSRRVSSLLLLVGMVLLAPLMLTFYSLPSQDAVRERTQAVKEKVQYYMNRPGEARPEAADCTDPYRQPGYLYQPANYTDSVWIPYTSELLSLPDVESADYPPTRPDGPLFNVSAPEDAILSSPTLPHSHMSDLLSAIAASKSGAETPDSPDAPGEWLRNRRFLVIGDSVDRFMTQFLCEEAGHKMTEPARHTTASCHIPELNFTAVHWHFPGHYTTRPGWWWMPEMALVPFEERFEQLWKPTLPELMGEASGGTRPDLILWQSGLWDQRVLWEAGQSRDGEGKGLGDRNRQMVWEEVRFLTARMRKFVTFVEDTFGKDVPIMYRTPTLHRESRGNDATLYEIDRISRFVATEKRMEMFEWGRIVAAQEALYMDKTHIARGAGSWLYWNMALDYMKRGLDGWETCHEQLLGWGGR